MWVTMSNGNLVWSFTTLNGFYATLELCKQDNGYALLYGGCIYKLLSLCATF